MSDTVKEEIKKDVKAIEKDLAQFEKSVGVDLKKVGSNINPEPPKKSNFFKRFALEFQKFINRGNVIDLAVGIIIGGAFSKIVNSFVNDIFMPIFGTVLGGVNLAGKVIEVGDVIIAYGNFLQNVIDFLIMAFCIFLIIKAINAMTPKKPAPAPVVDKKAQKDSEIQIQLLTEIRDELKKSAKK